MATVTKPKTDQNLLSLMRRLRAILPSDVKKFSPTEYLVAGRAKVVLNYHCRWDSEETQKRRFKECHPASITISADTEEFDKKLYGQDSGTRSVPSKIFRTRTVSKRQDGEINIESVAVAVTKCIESFDAYLEARKNQEQIRKANRAARDEKMNELEKQLKPLGLKRNHRSDISFADDHRWNSPRTQVEVNQTYRDDDSGKLHEFTFTLSVEKITQAQLLIAVKAIHQAGLIKS